MVTRFQATKGVFSHKHARFLDRSYFGPTKELRQLAVITDDVHFLPAPNGQSPVTHSSTGKRKRVDCWPHRADPQTATKLPTRSWTETLPVTDQFQLS